MKLNAVLTSLCLASLVTAKAIHKAENLDRSLSPKPIHRAENVDSRLSKRQYADENTSNQLIDGTPCRDITVIFAKGTFEGGNLGAVVGPQFAQQLVNITSVDQIAVQGVNYTNDVPGFLAGGDANGSALMAQYATQAAYQCPDTNLVLSGYSQGAQLVHNAAAMLTDCITAFVSSVVVFGDPDQTKPVGNIPESKVIRFCHDSDSICHGGYSITAAHLNYSEDVGTAASFVVGHAVLS